MQYIVDFFKALADIIENIIKFIIDLFTGLFEFFKDIPEYEQIIERYIELLPDWVIPFAVMVLAAQLIFIIIGRRGK